MTGDIVISVCIVSRRRTDALSTCLARLHGQHRPPPWELLIAADDDPDTARLVPRLHPGATVLPTSGLTLGANRNRLTEQARGSILLYLDDDTEPGPTLLTDLEVSMAHHPSFDVFGGPNLTPPTAGAFEQAQGDLLANPLITGAASKRYRQLRRPAPTNGPGLTLCNLAIRARVQPRFPEHQLGGEETTMLHVLRRRGSPMLRHPALTVHHARRPDLRSFATQMRKYGHGRGEELATHGPALAVAIAGVAIVSVRSPRGRRTAVVALGTHLLAIATTVITSRRRSGARATTTMTQGLIVVPNYLLGAALGYLRGARRPSRSGRLSRPE